MLFSSITFLYYFLPIVLVLYFLTPEKFRNIVLLVGSLVFYAWGEPKIVFYMLLTVTVSFVLGQLTVKKAKYKKLWLCLAVIFCIGSLAYFKYAGFFVENINAVTGLSVTVPKVVLPIGISFYTFQILSYNVDVYRGEVEPQKSWVNLAAYISMFPQLIAGPIVRYHDIEKQLKERKNTIDKAAEGIRRFIYGLGKKVLIANTLGELCMVFRASDDKSVIFYWMYAAAFALQIYFDFSGYSDMAIGLGKILGFDFLENFNYPFISKSITEFWRRWHISLGSWFRDYVYFPLGGSRVSNIKTYFNILIVWMLTGLWHGAAWNFVIWGLYFAVLLLIEKTFLLKVLNSRPLLSHIYVMSAAAISFVIFNGADMGEIASDLAGMFAINGAPIVSDETIYYLKQYGLILAAACIGATPVVKNAAEKCRKLQYMEPVLPIVLMVVITAYLIDGSFNPFLYFRF